MIRNMMIQSSYNPIEIVKIQKYFLIYILLRYKSEIKLILRVMVKH